MSAAIVIPENSSKDEYETATATAINDSRRLSDLTAYCSKSDAGDLICRDLI